MADPIDRDELLNVYKGYKDFDKIYIGSLRAEIKAQPPVTPKREWIPVAERLPEVGEWVITCDINGEVDMYPVDEKGYWIKGDGIVKTEIVAWMPLPQPYKGKEQ